MKFSCTKSYIFDLNKLPANMTVKTMGISSCFLLMGLMLWAQEDGYKSMPLQDMSQFQSQAGNWRIVGDVLMDPTVDVHPPSTPEESAKKKRKKKKSKTPEPPQAVHYTPGTGILLNLNNQELKDALITNWEHGDIDISLEVMLPKGSNSGIYLQGRYEVQLLDSWGVKNPKFSDIGGIYRNWESEPDKIYMGKAPLTNAAKAPGLWQKLDIAFRAPRFDANGNKISHAFLAFVDLNGIRIHENVAIPLPTGGPISAQEVAQGPLMIQGDHGPVAFRNIKYRILRESKVSLSELQYQVYHEPITSIDELDDAKVVYQGTQPALSHTVAKVPDKFAVRYQGNIVIPEDGRHSFNLAYTGGAVMDINGARLINQQRPDGWWRNDQAEVDLKKGTYPISIIYYKNAEWMPPRLALSVSSNSTYTKSLHDFSSYPPSQNPVSAIPVNVQSEVRLLRAFLDFKGDVGDRLTHTIAVGEPNGINYVYDLGKGSIAAVWRGDFIDATPMWHERGDGSFRPRGAAVFLQNSHALQVDSNSEYKPLGYLLDEQGRPAFQYQYGTAKVTDRIFPGPTGNELIHEVEFEGTTADSQYILAESNDIITMPDGSYAIDDQSYYIKVNKGVVNLVTSGGKSLLQSNTQESLSYTVIW